MRKLLLLLTAIAITLTLCGFFALPSDTSVLLDAAYAEITSPISIATGGNCSPSCSGTTPIISAQGVFDGTPVDVTFYAPEFGEPCNGSSGASQITFVLLQGSWPATKLGTVDMLCTSSESWPLSMSTRISPPASTTSISVIAYSTHGGTVYAGDGQGTHGGAIHFVPAYLRATH